MNGCRERRLWKHRLSNLELPWTRTPQSSTTTLAANEVRSAAQKRDDTDGIGGYQWSNNIRASLERLWPSTAGENIEPLYQSLLTNTRTQWTRSLRHEHTGRIEVVRKGLEWSGSWETRA